MTKKKVGVYIGRFQPFHNGHKAVLEQATKDNDLVVLLIGRSAGPPTFKNPWSYLDRMDMIYNIGLKLAVDNDSCVCIFPLDDVPGDDAAWVAQVKARVQEMVATLKETEVPEISLYGCDKDASTYYLSLFPEWKQALFKLHSIHSINATDIRKKYFSDAKWRPYQPDIPSDTYAFMAGWRHSQTYKDIAAQQA